MKPLFYLLSLSFLVSCQLKNDSINDNFLIPGARETVRPVEYISIDSVSHSKYFGEWTINGTIVSNTNQVFKDVKIEVVYYSKTNTEIGKETYTVYEFVSPTQSPEFSLKSYGFEGAETIKLNVLNAISVESTEQTLPDAND